MSARAFAPARVVARTALGGGYHHLILEAAHLARGAAGTFAMIAPRPGGTPGDDLPLLRPFSFLSRDPRAGRVELFFREVGRGTRALARVVAGELLPALGPLGRGFAAPSPGPVVLLAGGVGMPPLLDLATGWGGRARVVCYYGGRGRGDLHFLDRFEAAGIRLVTCTDDGSAGLEGTNLAAFGAALKGGERPATVYACGPTPMLRAARRLCLDQGLRLELSLEANMACGIGVCRGCAVARPMGDSDVAGYAMVCQEGPVFPATEVSL